MEGKSFKFFRELEYDRLSHRGEFPICGVELEADVRALESLAVDYSIDELGFFRKDTIRFTVDGHPYDFDTLAVAWKHGIELLKHLESLYEREFKAVNGEAESLINKEEN